MIDAFKPFNLGNVLAQVEQIKNARYARDPQNPGNVLRQLQIEAARQNLAQGPGDQWGYDTIPAYDEKGNLQLYRASRGGDISRVEFPEGVQPAIPGTYKDVGGFLRFLSNLGGVNPQQTVTQPAGQGAGVVPPTADVQKTYAPGQSPEEKAAAARAVAEAQQQVERESPEAVAREAANITEAQEAIETIDALLAPRGDKRGKVLTYAYGRGNLAPDFVKPQTWVDAEAQRDRVIALIQLANVGKLKGTGPITENEQKILAQAASALRNPLISPDLAEKEMRRVRNLFAIKAKGYKPEMDQPAPAMTDEDFIDWNSL